MGKQFMVNTKKLHDVSTAMYEQDRQLQRMLTELQEITMNLRRMSGMEEIVRTLGILREQVYREEKAMSRLSDAAERISKVYAGKEEGILSTAEHSGRHFKKHEVAVANWSLGQKISIY